MQISSVHKWLSSNGTASETCENCNASGEKKTEWKRKEREKSHKRTS